MLVLTRKLREEICIGNDITITVLRISGQSVRIGIEAPQDVRIVRGELEKQPPQRQVIDIPLEAGRRETPIQRELSIPACQEMATANRLSACHSEHHAGQPARSSLAMLVSHIKNRSGCPHENG